MRIALFSLAAVGILAAPALAHPEHDTPTVQRKPIGQAAQDAVVRLVTQAKLPASWSSAKPLNSATRTKDGAQQWVVIFRNDAIVDTAKRNLYVIMSPDGKFVSANHRLN